MGELNVKPLEDVLDELSWVGYLHRINDDRLDTNVHEGNRWGRNKID